MPVSYTHLIRENAAHHRSMKQALAASSTGIISEFQRRSPSKGWINEAAQAEEIPASCEAAGAAALSILTDEKFFGDVYKRQGAARQFSLFFSSMPTVGGKREITYLCPSDKTILSS